MSDAERADDEISSQAPQHNAPALPARSESESAEPEAAAPGELIPYYSAARRETPFIDHDDVANHAREHRPAQAARAPRDWGRLRAAASLAAVVAIGAAAVGEHVHAMRVARAGQDQTLTLTHRLAAMSTRLESLESNRSRDELANLRKVLAEIKTSAASTRDVGGAVGQLAARVDHLEKDQGARLDKLGDRIDHDAAARLADITARLDKLEVKAAASIVAVAPAKASPASKTVVAKADPGVALDTTGAIDRPPPRLRRYWLAQIHDGYAMIDSPMGEFAVGPGDVVPGGGGRVLRIERRGRAWAVITTQGQIVAADD